ncbi:ABC transporter ATP-binding protein [Candidatus Harpocratesius sp.]
MNKLIEVKNVSKSFVSKYYNISVLENLNLDIKEGDFITIKGKSGVGKTTFFKLLMGLLKPTSGFIFWNSKDIFNLYNSNTRNYLRRKFISMIFEDLLLISNLTVWENLYFPLSIQNQNFDEARSRIKFILNQLGIAELYDKKIYQISGGEQQRVAIARSLIVDPKIIIADEPTGFLDAENTSKIVELFQILNKEKNIAFVIVSHDSEVYLAGKTKYHLKNKILNLDQ